MWNDNGKDCPSCQDSPSRVISLSRYTSVKEGSTSVKKDIREEKTGCLNVYHVRPEAAVAFLDSAGAARFQEKAARFRQELCQDGANDVLYRGIFCALGYTKNKAGCLELAQRAPPERLNSCSDIAEIQSVLLGTAGLLNDISETRVKEDYLLLLESIWQKKSCGEIMNARSWDFYKVRPQNFPARRIAGMSYLWQRYRSDGLFESILKKAREYNCLKLRDSMVIAGDGYWIDHYNPGSRSFRPLPYLIGLDRATEIVINVILPLLYAWADLNKQPSFRDGIFDLNRIFPGSSGNSVERHVAGRWGMPLKALKTAIHEQGALHIYKTFCAQGRCEGCGMNYSPSFNPAVTSRSFPESLPVRKRK